jgi:hypothetical protein
MGTYVEVNSGEGAVYGGGPFATEWLASLRQPDLPHLGVNRLVRLAGHR